jgi:hypothetical protein
VGFDLILEWEIEPVDLLADVSGDENEGHVVRRLRSTKTGKFLKSASALNSCDEGWVTTKKAKTKL